MNARYLFLAVLCAGALPVFSENLTAGYGLVDAVANSEPVGAYPFRAGGSVFEGGAVGGSATHAIDRSGPNCWAPECIYQLERYGAMAVTFPNLVPGHAYVVELHLTENYFGGSSGGGAGSRVFNVAVNGTTVLSNYDIYVAAGGPYIAICKQFLTTANDDGNVVVRFTNVTDNGHLSGVALWGQTVPGSPPSFQAEANGSSMSFTWGKGTDVFRYYIQKGESNNGPWTDLTVCTPDVTTTTVAGCHDITATEYYRVIASNGVGIAASQLVTFTAQVDYLDIATRGSTVPNNASANVRINTVGAAGDPLNTLAADTVTVNLLAQNASDASTLAMGAGQLLKAGTIGVFTGAGNLIIGDTLGQGSVTGRDGMIVLRADDAGSTLTLNAQVTDDGATPLQIGTYGAGTVELLAGIGFTGSVTLGEGTFQARLPADSTFTTPVNGAGRFRKMGEGIVTLMNPLPDLTGEFAVGEGTVLLGASDLFPNSATRLVVEDGATLDVASDAIAAQGMNAGVMTVVASGSGVDGKGAIVNNSTHSQYNAFHVGELAGDVVFGGANKDARWDFRSSGDYKTFKMNGHSITKVGPNMVCLTGMDLTEGGPAVVINVNEGTWSSETTTSYSGGSAHTMNVASGALFDLYAMTIPFTWTLNLADGGTVNFRYGALGQNEIAGPVSLAGAATVSGGGNGTFSGPISGPGALTVAMTDGYRTTLKSGNNSYAGGTQVTGGDLYATAKGDLPGYDNAALLSVDGGTLVIPVDSSDWTVEDVKTIIDHDTLKSENSCIGLDITGALTFDETFALSVGGIAKFGAGSLTFTKPLQLNNGRLEAAEGTLTIANGTETYVSGKGVNVRGSATLNITSGSRITVPVASCNLPVGTLANQTARLNIVDGTFVTETPLEYNVGTGGIILGNADNAIAVMTVSGDSLISNKVIVANSTGSQGAIYQNGGTIVNSGGAANDIRIGQNGYGYHELNDGKLVFLGYSQVGGTGASSQGYFVQHGGDFEQNTEHVGRLALCRGGNGGKGVIYQDGGTFRVLTSVQVGEWDNTHGGVSWWTVDGQADAFVQDEIHLCNRTNHTAVLNINGGTLSPKQIKSRTSPGAENKETAHAYVNFNGGVLKPNAGGQIFATGDNLPDAVTIYSNGAVIDTDFVSDIAAPLLAPVGNGISSITLPASVTSGTYIGPPDIAISGDGFGASAIALFDSKTGKVTGVKITSPGYGYTTAPTVTVSGGGSTASVTATATIQPNAMGGGLTKRGTGTLSLDVANTFCGPLVIEDGILSLGADGAFPAGNDLTLTGGALQGNGGAVTAGVAQVTSGSLLGVNLIADAFTKSGSGELAIAGSTISLGTGHSGLYAGLLSGAFNVTDPNPETQIAASPLMANSTTGWSDNTTWIYSGYIWNRGDSAATWTFCKFFDDSMLLTIDGNVLINNGNWADVLKATVTLDPGPHTFELRLGQGSGGAGPSGNTGSDLAKLWNGKGIGFGIDFQGRDSVDDPAYFTKLEEYEGIDQLFTINRVQSNDVVIDEGMVSVNTVGAGLFAGELEGQNNVDASNPKTSITLSPVMGNQTTGWRDNTTWVYSGYIWNRSENPVTWSFAECVDDDTVLKIDGELVINDHTWNNVTVATRTLNPGPHTFEVRFGQGGGGAGPAGNFGTMGFGIDFQGRGSNDPAYYVVPTDPGDGSLFTPFVKDSGPFISGDETRLVLGDAATLRFFDTTAVLVPNMTASGTVDMGDLAISNTLYIDGNDLANGSCLTVTEGTLDLSACRRIVITNIEALGKSGSFPVIDAPNGIKGSLNTIEVEGIPAGEPWTLTIRKDGRLTLSYQGGTVMIMR